MRKVMMIALATAILVLARVGVPTGHRSAWRGAWFDGHPRRLTLRG